MISPPKSAVDIRGAFLLISTLVIIFQFSYNMEKGGMIMTDKFSSAALKIIRKMQQNELTESVIYEKIAGFAKGEENKQTLLRLAGRRRLTTKSGKSIPGRK